MSKKSIIAIITVVVLLFIAGISVGVFLYTRGETAAVDGDQTSTTTPEQENDGNRPVDGDQTENNDNSDTDPNIGNETENPETPVQNEGEESENNNDNENNDNADNEAVNNDNTANNEGNTENNNDDENAEITTGTDVNEVGETTITRYEEVERIVSRQFFDWWEPMAIKVDQPTVLDVEKPQLDVRKSVITGVGGDNFVYAGQDLTYVISVTNNSEVDVKNIEITDKIPENTTFVSIEDAVIANEVVGTKTTVNSENVVEGVKWVVTVPAGETVVARFTVNVNENKLDENGVLVPLTGTILNTAIANGEKSTGDDGEEETKTSIIIANKSSVITRIQDNEEITEGIEAARIGDIITYTITVSNTGDGEGKTYISDKVPTGTEFVSAEGDAIVSEEKDTVAWSISLAANETITRSFKVRVTSIDSEIINIANVGGTDTNTDTTKVESYIVFEENGGSEVEDLTGIKGEPITDRNMPTTERPGYVFDGWYADPEFTGEKVTNLPENYPAGTTTYYAKWTPRADLTGIVNYYLKDTTTKLAKSKELTGLVFNSQVTESAIEIPGYNKFGPTEQTITVKLEGNEINFYYEPRTDLTGIVNYYLKDTTTKLAESKELTGLVFNSTVTESAIDIPGYNKLAPIEQTITVELEGNEINFYYEPRTDLTGIVNYYLKDTTTKLAESKELTGLVFNSTVTENAIEIPGYEKVDPTEQTITVGLEGNEINFYYTPVTGLTGIVNYYLEGTTTKLAESKELTGLVFNSQVTESAIEIPGYEKVDPTEQTITVGLEGNEINFYYTPVTGLTGIVNYYLKDTTTKLAESKELTGLVFNSEITESAIEIPGYNKVDPTEQTITVKLEGNEINFYYEKAMIDYTVKYYYDGIQDDSKTDNLKAEFDSIISTYTDKNIDGYKFDKTSGLPLKVTADPTRNIIEVYYIRDEFSYTVKYYKDGEAEPFEVNQDLKALFGSQINAEDVDTSNMPAGYKLDRIEGTPLTITSNPENNIIEVYYVKDEISYTVEYYKDGETEPFETSQGLKALLGSQINAEDIDTSNMPNGYQLDRIEGTPLTISADPANNIIRVYYGKPDISIEKLAPKTAKVGEEVTYTIKLTNTGKARGTVTTVTDILPEGVTYVRSDNGGIYANGVVTWSNIEVPANNGITNLTVTVKINADQIGKTIENTAKLSDDTPSSTPENKTDKVTTKINEISGVEVGTKPGEQGKDANNIVLVIDLSSSMNEKIYTFVKCTHEHSYNWWGEYCPEGCEEQWSTGIWGKNVSQGTRLEAAKKAAQEFIKEVYKNPDSKATITVVTFNQKSISNRNKYVGTRVLTFGKNNDQTTATNKNYQDLITEIGNIDIGTATSGYGTHIKAALDKTYDVIYDKNNGLVATYPNNSNVVIFLGDGDPTSTRTDGYEDNSKNNITNTATKIKDGENKRSATIYSIGFGSDAIDPDSDAYEVLGDISSDGKVRTAEDAESLADIFRNLEEEMNPQKPVTTTSGKITIQLEKNLVINSENKLVVEYNGEELFSCSTLPNNYVAYNANTKQLTFDINAYNADQNNTTKITDNSVIIRYFIER